MNLYEISGKLAYIEQLEDDEEYKNDEEFKQKIDEIKEELEEMLKTKNENIIKLYRNLDTNIQAIKQEQERLRDLKASNEKMQERLKEFLKVGMDNLGIKKVETTLGNITKRANPLSVEVLNENLVPNEYKEVVKTVKIDKNKLKEQFKTTGELIEGVKFITDKESIVIK